MSASRIPLRPELQGIEPYGAPQIDVPVTLNVNENPYGPSEKIIADVTQEVAKTVGGLNRYPDRDFSALRAGLADFINHESAGSVTQNNIWAANGSNEVMLHLFQAFGGPGRKAVTFTPSYSMYPEYARDTLTQWVTYPRGDNFDIDIDVARRAISETQPSLVVVASPNNPTGTALPLATVKHLARAADEVETGCLLVVDEAYAEFRREQTPSAVTLLDEFQNLVVTRTMSKAFALAGARLGYLAAGTEIVNALRVVRLPYHLSAVTQAVASTALRHSEELLTHVAQLRTERDDLVSWLTSQGYDVAPSDANFVFFGSFPNRHEVWQGLLQRGVLIRETGPDGWLRVSVGTPAEMSAFKNALVEVTGE